MIITRPLRLFDDTAGRRVDLYVGDDCPAHLVEAVRAAGALDEAAGALDEAAGALDEAAGALDEAAATPETKANTAAPENK